MFQVAGGDGVYLPELKRRKTDAAAVPTKISKTTPKKAAVVGLDALSVKNL
jgi:hypothetical protein